jgi:probable phosphoglycerate mutase
MQLTLVRHGLPLRTAAIPGVRRTPPDPQLSAVGLDQARRVAAGLADERIDAVYSSPLRRAVQTVGPLAERLGLPVRLDDGVHEIDIGEDSYIPMEELTPGDPRAAEWRAVFDNQTGDLITGFRTRVGAAIDAVIARHPGDHVLVGCHAGVITAVLAHLLGVERTFSFVVDYASVTRVRIRRDGRVGVLAVNDRAHLVG